MSHLSHPNHPDDHEQSASGGDLTHESGVIMRGIGASPGVAVGTALLYQQSQPIAGATSASAPLAGAVQDTEAEHARLRQALADAAEELRALAKNVRHEVTSSTGDIFEAQALMLEDPTIAERADSLIDGEHCDAPTALYHAVEEQAAALAALPDPLWQARAVDIRDASQRAQTHLQPLAERPPTLAERLEALAEPVIIVAHDLAPSETALMRAGHVLGIALAEGSATSHAAILARALGIPAVVGIGAAQLKTIQPGDTLIINATHDTVILRPGADKIAQAHQAEAQHTTAVNTLRAHATEWRDRPGQTRDGHHVAILANVGSLQDAQEAVEMGAEGVGLLRTEFLFAEHPILPGVEEQAAMYSEIIAAFGPHNNPVTIRTLDAGTDKPLESLVHYMQQLPEEANAALGVRGIRLHHRFPELLINQFRAVLLAAARSQAQLRIMLPMVGTLEELREASALLQAAESMNREQGAISAPIPSLGIMIETPAAVLMADALSREATFFSVGANDLAQFVMAADRLNAQLTYLSRPTEPALVRAISLTVLGARKAGRPVSVCGEMAADPQLALLLVGLGVDELSMAPASIPSVKQALAGYTMPDLRALAERALRAETRGEVEAILEQLAPV